MPSKEENSQQNDVNLAEFKTTISHLNVWLRREVGVPEKFQENQLDGANSFIERIYRFNKCDVARTKRFLYKYFKMRCAGGPEEIFHNRNSDSDEVLKSCQGIYFFTVPQLTKRGHRIICIKIAPSKSLEDFDPKAFFKRFFMMSDIRFEEEREEKKEVFILDMDDFTKQNAVKLFSGGFITKFVKCLMEIYPRRVHAIHVIRTKQWHRNSLNLWLKVSGVSKKMANRIKCYSMEDEQMEGIDQQFQKLSGKIQDLNDVWTQKLITRKGWFESQDALFMSITPKNVKLLPVKVIKPQEEEELKISHHSEVYTFERLEGSFRKLET